MPNSPNSFDGWSLAEAGNRCLALDLVARFQAAESEWQSVGSPLSEPEIVSFWDAPEKRDKSAKERKAFAEYQQLRQEHYSAFCELLIRERLFGFGRIGKTTANREAIPPSAWKNLNLSEKADCLDEPDGSSIFDVCIYPPVYATNIQDRLHGRGLGEAFIECVLKDPEVEQAAVQFLEEQPHHEAVFKQGKFPGPSIQYSWPVESSEADYTLHFQRTGVVVIDRPLPPSSEVLKSVAALLHDRMRAFRALLQKGLVSASGTYVKTGEYQSINRRQWDRATIEIDVQSGDFLERIGNQTMVQWSGVELSKGDQTLQTEDVAASVSQRTGSSNSTKTECRKWLISEMKKSPKIKTKPKSEWWKEAQERFGSVLSYNAFLDAWSQAIEATEAYAWQRAGAPKKSN
jgi:hypothetical protein